MAEHETTAGTARGVPGRSIPFEAGRPAGDSELPAFTFASERTLADVHHNVSRMRAMMMARRPLGWLKIMAAVWLGVTLAGLTLALLAFLAAATFLAAAVDDVQGDIDSSLVDPSLVDPSEYPTDIDGGTFDPDATLPSDIPTDLPIGEEAP